MSREILNKIGQLQYEISLLEHSKEELTGVTNRTDELKDLVKKIFSIPDVTHNDTCDEYVDGINMDCSECGEAKYRHTKQ